MGLFNVLVGQPHFYLYQLGILTKVDTNHFHLQPSTLSARPSVVKMWYDVLFLKSSQAPKEAIATNKNSYNEAILRMAQIEGAEHT